MKLTNSYLLINTLGAFTIFQFLVTASTHIYIPEKNVESKASTSVRPLAADPPFYMIFASDLQYPRALDPNGSENNDLKSKSETLNRDHLTSMNKLINKYNADLKGVVFNGDLTEDGHGDELDKYKAIYSGLKAPLFPGLGNHDYERNVDDCALNGCANQMIDYLKNTVQGIHTLGFDYIESNSYKFPDYITTYTGSLAYSWDINNVHFVQLNNYPTYTKQWSNFVSKSAKRKTYDIKSAIPWLKNDLAIARDEGKIIIINFHDPGQHWDGNGADVQKERNDFAEILKYYNVSAVFVGHIHSNIGLNNNSNYSFDSIPVFFCGSSIYSHYLFVEFNNKMMTVKQINSVNGDTAIYSNKTDTITLRSITPRMAKPVPALAGYATFFNEGGYTARFSLSYTFDGQTSNFETGDLALGNKKKYDIPAGAINVHISGQDKTGLLGKNAWKTIFDLNFPGPPNKCFKVYGTTLKPNYDNNCN